MDFLKFLFTFKGTVSRKQYAMVGFGLMPVKYGIDVLIVYLLTGKFWTPLQYFSPLLSTKADLGLPAMICLGIAMVPFAFIGISMSIRRAYDAGISASTAVCFILPFINYVYMLWMCIVPTRDADTASTENPRVGALVVAVTGAAVVALILVPGLTFGLKNYSGALFMVVPFTFGFFMSFFYRYYLPDQKAPVLMTSLIGTAGIGLLMILFALEGAICIMMAVPIAFPFILAGVLLGNQLVRDRGFSTKMLAAPALLYPLVVGGIETVVDQPLERKITTSTEIAAAPEVIWPNLVNFSELPPPNWLLFKLGVAYPVRAVIDGEGVGAVRRCEFSTGAFVEPITVWDEPRHLAFDVLEQPDTMAEWSPYRSIHPPHLDGYFQSEKGEFRLETLPNGGTMLHGTTWYSLKILPGWYWQVWTDFIIHSIHERVLAQIKRQSEAG